MCVTSVLKGICLSMELKKRLVLIAELMMVSNTQMWTQRSKTHASCSPAQKQERSLKSRNTFRISEKDSLLVMNQERRGWHIPDSSTLECLKVWQAGWALLLWMTKMVDSNELPKKTVTNSYSHQMVKMSFLLTQSCLKALTSIMEVEQRSRSQATNRLSRLKRRVHEDLSLSHMVQHLQRRSRREGCLVVEWSHSLIFDLTLNLRVRRVAHS